MVDCNTKWRPIISWTTNLKIKVKKKREIVIQSLRITYLSCDISGNWQTLSVFELDPMAYMLPLGWSAEARIAWTSSNVVTFINLGRPSCFWKYIIQLKHDLFNFRIVQNAKDMLSGHAQKVHQHTGIRDFFIMTIKYVYQFSHVWNTHSKAFFFFKISFDRLMINSFQHLLHKRYMGFWPHKQDSIDNKWSILLNWSFTIIKKILSLSLLQDILSMATARSCKPAKQIPGWMIPLI